MYGPTSNFTTVHFKDYNPHSEKKILDTLSKITANTVVFRPIDNSNYAFKNYRVVKCDDSTWNCVKIISGKKIMLANVFLKISAFAYCKLLDQHRTSLADKIVNQDRFFEKNYHDCLFYKRIINSHRDSAVRDSASSRYEMARAQTTISKKYITSMLLSAISNTTTVDVVQHFNNPNTDK